MLVDNKYCGVKLNVSFYKKVPAFRAKRIANRKVCLSKKISHATEKLRKGKSVIRAFIYIKEVSRNKINLRKFGCKVTTCADCRKQFPVRGR